MKKSYITYLGTSRDYLLAALVLNESLKKTHAQYPLSVIVDKTVADNYVHDVLEAFEISVIEKPVLKTPAVIKEYNQNRIPHWSNTFIKLYINDLSFDKVAGLDADCYVHKNIDNLFDCPSWTVENYFCAKDKASEDYPVLFNSAVMVVEPDREQFDACIRLLNEYIPKKEHGIGDENIFTKMIQKLKLPVHSLPFGKTSWVALMNECLRWLDYDVSASVISHLHYPKPAAEENLFPLIYKQFEKHPNFGNYYSFYKVYVQTMKEVRTKLNSLEIKAVKA